MFILVKDNVERHAATEAVKDQLIDDGYSMFGEIDEAGKLIKVKPAKDKPAKDKSEGGE